jgi:hypothetical protein
MKGPYIQKRYFDAMETSSPLFPLNQSQAIPLSLEFGSSKVKRHQPHQRTFLTLLSTTNSSTHTHTVPNNSQYFGPQKMVSFYKKLITICGDFCI